MDDTEDLGLYNAEIYPCKSCGPFPLFNLKDVTAQILKAVQKHPLVVPDADLENFNLLRDVVAPPLAQALSTFEPKIRSATMIKDTIPQFSPHLGGAAFGPNGRANIPLYVCNECRALFVLPSEVGNAIRKVDPVNGSNTAEDLLRSFAVRAMQNAYQSLEPIKAAQVYCFKEFVVMVDYTTHPGRGRSFFRVSVVPLIWLVEGNTEKEKDLPVNDITGLLEISVDK